MLRKKYLTNWKKYQIMKIKALLLVLLLTIFGCTEKTIVKPMPENTIQNCKVEYDLQPPVPIVLRDVEFKVLTFETLQNIVESGERVTFIALSPDDYEKLSLNMIDIKGLLEYNRKTYFIFKEYYAKPEESQTSETP